MLLTVTPNLCIERTVLIPEFVPGKVHRVPPQSLFVNAGGKGVNAARVAAQLGTEVLATAWVGRQQHGWFHEQLKQEGVAHELVEVDADTRACLNIVHGNGTKTEVVEAGAPLSIDDGTDMLKKFESLLPRSELVAICGSYPPAHENFDTHLTLLCALARRHGKRVLVDGKGRSFEMLLNSPFLPWAIKPNTDEAAAFLKYPVNDEAAEKCAVSDLLELGVEVVLLSCGRRGAYLGTRQSIQFCAPAVVTEISAVGSGDSFVGAFAAKYLQKDDLLHATQWGCAAGAASAAQVRSGFCSRTEIEEIYQREAT